MRGSSTHLGNGIASTLPRHPNPIWEQAAIDDLSASFIADGHHLDLATLRVLARAKGPARTILVSDASPLAGLPPGTYGDWAVDPSGKIVVAGTPYLAGSNQGLEVGVRNLLVATGWAYPKSWPPSRPTPPGSSASRASPRTRRAGQLHRVPSRRARSDLGRHGFDLRRMCVDGEWTETPASQSDSRLVRRQRGTA